MSSDLEYWSESYTGAVDELAAIVLLINGTVGDERVNLVSECDAKLCRAQSIRRSYCLEVRLLRDKAIKRTYEQKLKGLDTRCTEIRHDVECTRGSSNRQELLGAPPAHSDFKGNANYLDDAGKIQDQTQDALSRTMHLVEASSEVGHSALNELERQQEQARDITTDVMIIEDNLTRADKLIRNFTKRMMTDKLIVCFAFVNMCGLIGIVVYCVVTGRGLGTEGQKEDRPDERRLGPI